MNIESTRIDTRTTLKCKHCSYSSGTHINQHQLHLWCNKRSTVHECLSDYCSATILDDFSCGNGACSGRGGSHTTSIVCEPEVMVLNMQRPHYDRRQKIALDCPLEGLRPRRTESLSFGGCHITLGNEGTWTLPMPDPKRRTFFSNAMTKTWLILI